jgi:hypothetical protein
MITKLTEFILSERKRYSLEDDNRFGTAFSHLTRYYRFLCIIVQRYHDASQVFMQNTRMLRSLTKPGTHPTTPEQDRLHEEGYELTTRLHLEIESFYLFAKILLDKASHVMEFYFGQGRSCSLDSHDDLVRHLETFAEQKGITLTQQFVEIANVLKKDISDHRDYQIAHEKSPRTTHATLFDAEGRTRILSSRFYPTERDQQAETQELNKLMGDLDRYLAEFMKIIAANRDKTKLELVEAKQD